eukprot:g7912.t1
MCVSVWRGRVLKKCAEVAPNTTLVEDYDPTDTPEAVLRNFFPHLYPDFSAGTVRRPECYFWHRYPTVAISNQQASRAVLREVGGSSSRRLANMSAQSSKLLPPTEPPPSQDYLTMGYEEETSVKESSCTTRVKLTWLLLLFSTASLGLLLAGVFTVDPISVSQKTGKQNLEAARGLIEGVIKSLENESGHYNFTDFKKGKQYNFTDFKKGKQESGVISKPVTRPSFSKLAKGSSGKLAERAGKIGNLSSTSKPHGSMPGKLLKKLKHRSDRTDMADGDDNDGDDGTEGGFVLSTSQSPIPTSPSPIPTSPSPSPTTFFEVCRCATRRKLRLEGALCFAV